MKLQTVNNYRFVWFIWIGLILGNFLFSCLGLVATDLSVLVVGFATFLAVLNLLEELAFVLLVLLEALLMLFLIVLEVPVLLFVAPTVLLLVIFLLLELVLLVLEADVWLLLAVDLDVVDFELALFTFDLLLDELTEAFVFEDLVVLELLLGFEYVSAVL